MMLARCANHDLTECPTCGTYAVITPMCQHCGDLIEDYALAHWQEGFGHEGLCCDCMDLSCGMPLHLLNKEREAKGKQPITKAWPGRDDHGNKVTG